jgi:hypothetical protein
MTAEYIINGAQVEYSVDTGVTRPSRFRTRSR